MEENLIELIQREGVTYFAERIADHLIANGVTVQKRGRWEKYGYKWKCNNCLEKINIDGTPEENGLYYCPNCGADMRGEEHESD